MKLFKKSFTIFFLLATCCASLTWAQSSSSFSSFLLCAGEKMREPNGNFYCNPLMLEGVAFNDNVFTLKSNGELKLEDCAWMLSCVGRQSDHWSKKTKVITLSKNKHRNE